MTDTTDKTSARPSKSCSECSQLRELLWDILDDLSHRSSKRDANGCAVLDLGATLVRRADEAIERGNKATGNETNERRLAEACERLRRCAGVIATHGDLSLAGWVDAHARRLLGDIKPWWESEQQDTTAEKPHAKD